MKVAVAVGCLKSKPAGVSGREYAQQLCDRFQRGQLMWKKRYERAETEILHLKQQLDLQQNHTAENMEVAVADDGTGSDLLFPTPPSSGSHSNQAVSENCHGDNVSDSLSKNTVFLHHVISLQNGSKLFRAEDLDVLTKKSIEHSLDTIQEHIGDTRIPNKLQIRYLQTIDKLYRSCDCDLKRKILESAKVSAHKLITRILSREEYRTQTQTRHRELLQEFSNKKQIGVPVIELLADAIKTFSDSLRQVANKVQSLDPYYFCSCYYIIDILDQSLQTIDRDACGLSEEFRDQILSKLEDSLLHITEKFPLFAHAVWRLTAKLSS